MRSSVFPLRTLSNQCSSRCSTMTGGSATTQWVERRFCRLNLTSTSKSVLVFQVALGDVGSQSFFHWEVISRVMFQFWVEYIWSSWVLELDTKCNVERNQKVSWTAEKRAWHPSQWIWCREAMGMRWICHDQTVQEIVNGSAFTWKGCLFSFQKRMENIESIRWARQLLLLTIRDRTVFLRNLHQILWLPKNVAQHQIPWPWESKSEVSKISRNSWFHQKGHCACETTTVLNNYFAAPPPTARLCEYTQETFWTSFLFSRRKIGLCAGIWSVCSVTL